MTGRPTTSLLLAEPPRIAARTWWILWFATGAVSAALLLNNAAMDTWIWRSARWLFGNQENYTWATYRAEHAADPNPAFYMTATPPFSHVAADGTQQPRLFQMTEIWWHFFKDFAENITLVFLIVIVSIYSRKKRKAGVLFLAANLGANGISTLVRMTAGRYRPIAPPLMDGINRWALFRGFHETRDLSFPSGHATVAFASAATLIYLTPPHLRRPAAIVFLTLAWGTAISRVVMLAHFPSDVLVAGTLGFTVSWWITAWLDRLIKDPETAWTGNPASGAGS